MSSNKIKVEGMMSLEQAVSYLEDVLSSLKGGAIKVQAGEETMTLTPQSVVNFEMSLSQKKDKEKFKLEIGWKEGGKLSEDSLKISN
jgi:amphi-Trp domain-containing protein